MAPVVPPTRANRSCHIVGEARDISERVLPTTSDVVRLILHVRFGIIDSQGHHKDPPMNEVAHTVSTRVQEVWKAASIPTMDLKQIKQKVIRLNDKYMQLKKFGPDKQETKKYKQLLGTFQSDADKLFEIAYCRCDLDIERGCRICPKSHKVPKLEIPFLVDQRGPRMMAIGGVDVAVTKQITVKQERDILMKAQANLRREIAQKHKLEVEATVTLNADISEGIATISNESHVSDPDPDFILPTGSLKGAKRVKLSQTAKVADRFGISARATAAIASSTLQDFGIVTENDRTHVVDPAKVQRARRATRKAVTDDQISSHGPIQGLYFDGKRNDTITIENIDGSQRQRTVIEEHISLLSEPGSRYIGHVTPVDGTAMEAKDAILSYLHGTKYDVSTLSVIGADGTAVNTGPKGGIIPLLEKDLKRPLQWLICLLHFNELPLRHLMIHLDGHTTGPFSFSGPIGKELKTCEKKPVVTFKKIVVDLPDIDSNLLSTDQEILLDLCRAISEGHVPDKLANRTIGPLNHARWLTAGIRILRLYVSTRQPSKNLKTLTQYVMQVYSKVWFSIKAQWQFHHASRHVWETIKLSRFLPESLRRTVIDPCIQTNAFALHPENMAIALLTDSREEIRKQGVNLVLKARKEHNKDKPVRTFRPPKVNFQAEDYPELIDWPSFTPPPALAHISDQELEEAVLSPEAFLLKLPAYPCHTQAVERAVKLTTQASAKVCGEFQRDGFIRNTLASRQNMPKFESKKDYSCE